MNSENSTKEIAAVKEQVRLVEWREEIEARRTSGLSVRAWCAQQGLSLSAYYHRLRRVREAVCQQLGATEATSRSVTDQPAVVPVRKAEAAAVRGSCPDAKLFVHETWAYEEVTSYIDYIIRKNPEDFKQVAFIGTPYKKL